MEYVIRKAAETPDLGAEWDDAPWAGAETAQIAQYHERSSAHRPKTEVRMLYDDAAVYVQFQVEDQYIRCEHDQYQDPVWKDSCVEVFIQPKPDLGYFNFEMNCGGALLLSYVEDPTRTADGFAKFTRLPMDLGRQVEIFTTMPPIVDPEYVKPATWRLAAVIPYEVMAAYTGPLPRPQDREWRGNFFKCAESNSHPHWGAWAPVGEPLNFHKPECFRPFRFAV